MREKHILIWVLVAVVLTLLMFLEGCTKKPNELAGTWKMRSFIPSDLKVDSSTMIASYVFTNRLAKNARAQFKQDGQYLMLDSADKIIDRANYNLKDSVVSIFTEHDTLSFKASFIDYNDLMLSDKKGIINLERVK